jgi:hypothetical protein
MPSDDGWLFVGLFLLCSAVGLGAVAVGVWRLARRWRARRAWRTSLGADLSVPRCRACAATDCPGIAGGIEVCPGWQEAEARAARGEYLPTVPLRLSPRAADLIDRIEADER